jgi:hypothetical protein
MEGPVSKKKVRRVVLGEGYLSQCVEVSPTEHRVLFKLNDDTWKMATLMGLSHRAPVRLVAEIL